MYDLLIRNVQIVDGSGKGAFKSDITVADGKVVAVGCVCPETRARQVIEGEGLTLAPGFIDIHTHADGEILEQPTADNYVLQGVTTIVGGNCGGGPLPVGEFLSKADVTGLAINFATLVGHGSIREAVMSDPTAPATPEEIAKMKPVLSRALQEGAFGMSSGLEYIPGRWATRDELVELGSVVAEHGGIYSTHSRDEQTGVLESVAEAIEVGQRSGVSVEISHIKACGAEVWGYGPQISSMISLARSLGVNVNADQYPYEASNTGFSQCFPDWALEGGKEALTARLQQPELAAKIRSYATHQLRIRIGEDPSKIQVATYRADRSWEGLNTAQVLDARGQEATLANLVELVIESYLAGGPFIIYHYINPKDIEVLMRNPHVMVASDGGIRALGQGSPHPRSYGTFARVLGRYVRENHTITLEEAVRKMSSLPAAKLGLIDRGLVKPGYAADLVLFDAETVGDRSTFLQPHQYVVGVHYVIVNGQVVAEHGELTGARPGRALRKSPQPAAHSPQ